MKKKYAIGIDIGGTSIKYGICSESGELIEQNSIDTPSDAPKETILEKLSGLVDKGLKTAKESKNEIHAVGVGTPGSVDVERGFLMGNTPNFTQWGNVGISEYLRSSSALPVYADNDANLMAYGEYAFGAGKDRENVIFITLGTGIGGGIVVDGELYRGNFYAGAEIGHMTIHYEGRKCRCGGIGCWEQYASATAMIKDYNRINPDNKVDNTKQIFERYDNNETQAQRIIKQTIEYLGAGLANIINIFNPELIVIGGGVSEAGDWFIEEIYQAACRRAMDSSRKNVEIRAAKLGNRAGMMGAAAFALKMVQASDTVK